MVTCFLKKINKLAEVTYLGAKLKSCSCLLQQNGSYGAHIILGMMENLKIVLFFCSITGIF